VLREVFDLDYDEIAAAVDKRRPRSARSPTGHGPTSPRGVVSPAQTQDLISTMGPDRTTSKNSILPTT
jgi:RNA polymerase sigma-70 factor (ECF subfamily)